MQHLLIHLNKCAAALLPCILVNMVSCRNGWMILMIRKIITVIFRICMACFLPTKYLLTAHLQLYSAAKNTLIQRGDVSTGWSMGWKVNWWARMLDGNHAYKLIQNQLTPVGTNEGGGGTYNNLFDAHPPFQIDGNFGCTSGITEMLMQSADGAFICLPALPDVWQQQAASVACVQEVVLKLVNMQWKDGKW